MGSTESPTHDREGSAARTRGESWGRLLRGGALTPRTCRGRADRSGSRVRLNPAQVLSQPAESLLPSIDGGFRAKLVRTPVIEEGMPRVGVHLDPKRLPALCQSASQRLHMGAGNQRVLSAEQSQQGPARLGGAVDRVVRFGCRKGSVAQAPIEVDTDVGTVGHGKRHLRIDPAQAEADTADAAARIRPAT